MEDKAEVLLATWINGNRKDVMAALEGMASLEAAYVSARIVRGLMVRTETPLPNPVYGFIRMMERRLE